MDIRKKEELYIKAKESYYNGDPIMSDSEFDILEEKLKVSGSTIIKQVGSLKAGTFTHLSKMLSLAKVNIMDDDNMDSELNDIYDWASNQKLNGATRFESNCKYDGCSMNLIYEDGILLSGITRGDGDAGFDHKHKMSLIVPTRIPIKKTIEVRGEILIPKKVFFEKYVKNYSLYGLSKPPANERNFVSGVIARDTLSINTVKDFIFVAYELRIHEDTEWSYPVKNKTMDILEGLGFNDTYKPKIEYFTDYKDFKRIYFDFKNYRENECIFRLDGMVIKSNESVREKLGFNSHDPNWAVAIKFPPKDAITTINDIDWQTGTTGEVVPTAVLEPLLLDGTTVKRATLFNKDKISTMQAWPGAKVLVAKGGDIIPQIYKVITPSNNITPLPTHCPSCDSELVEDDKHLWCVNEYCYAQITKKIQAGVSIFKFRDVGGATVERLYSAGITSIEDYFDKKKFNKFFLIRSGKFVDGRELDKILEGVNNVYKVTLKQVIQSLKFKDTGASVSEQIARFLSKVDYDFKGLNKDAVYKLTDKNSEEYKRLMKFLVILKQNNINVKFVNNDTSNLKPIEMTGTPPIIGHLKHKSDWFSYLEDYGYIKGKMDKNMSYLICKDPNGTSGKIAKAKNLQTKHNSDIKIKSYEDFIIDVIQDENLIQLIKNPVNTTQKDNNKPVINNNNTLF